MSKDEAEFALTAPGQPIGPDSQLVVGLMLTNRSHREMYFNCRFAVVPAAGDVWPSLFSPSGSEVPYALRVRLAALRASDFMLLKPNQAVVAGVALRRLFNLKEHGGYKLSARYVSRETPPELASSPIFHGEIDAPPITFTI
jgi:hypothetical protein